MKQTPELHFDPAEHTYTCDGRKLPSVTQVLQAIWGPRPYWTEWHRDRGTAVHKAVEIIAKGGKVNPSTMDERIAGRVAGFELFLREHPNLQITASEMRVMHQKRFYAGTLDLLLLDLTTSAAILADIKGTIEPVLTYPQLGGYSLALQAEWKLDKGIAEAWAIELRNNGTYRLKVGRRGGRKSDFDLNEAEQAWLSILATYNWKVRYE